MATTAIWDVKDRLDRVLDYASNPEKTENADFQGLRDVLEYTGQEAKTEHQFYVTGIHCDPAVACEQMKQTKLRFQKTNCVLAFHGYQAFAPGEAAPEVARAIGVKLAQELWGERFEVVVSTHLDKKHLHNHFVINSVSFLDGKRYLDNKATYALMRRTSDRLCSEYGLSVMRDPQHGQAKQYAEWMADHEGKPTWRGIIRQDIDQAITASTTFTRFLTELRKQGYEVKTGVKYLAVRPPGKERFVRLRSLGAGYDEEKIKLRILQNRVVPKPKATLPDPERMHGSLTNSCTPDRSLIPRSSISCRSTLFSLFGIKILPLSLFYLTSEVYTISSAVLRLDRKKSCWMHITNLICVRC